MKREEIRMSFTMNISDIKIPEGFAKSVPGKAKMDRCRRYYSKNGCLDRDIVVDKNGYLQDGYIGYLVLVENGATHTEVIQKGYDREYRNSFAPQVGDWVKIRDGEDMEEEFGASENGWIECRFRFTKEMQSGIGGLEFEITEIKYDEYLGHDSEWKISKDMLMPAGDMYVDSDEVDKFLESIKVVDQ